MSGYLGINPKLICLSCESYLFKCCLAPLTIPLKMCYWDTCINSLNINHLLFTFVAFFVTVDRKQHVVCVYMCVKLKFKLYLRKWKKHSASQNRWSTAEIYRGWDWLPWKQVWILSSNKMLSADLFPTAVYGFKVELFVKFIQKGLSINTDNLCTASVHYFVFFTILTL